MNNMNENGLSVFVKYKWKLIKWGIIFGVVVIAILVVFFQGRSSATKKYEQIIAELVDERDQLLIQIDQAASTWDDQPTKEITIDLVESKISDIGELATIEYLYTDAGKFEDVKQAWGINIPFTAKSFILKWDGTIKAGVEVDKILVEVDADNKEIIVHMPDAEILSHEVDEENIEILDEKDGLFNKVTVENTVQFEATGKIAMEERAIENGILDKANENAQEIVEKLINNDIIEEQGYTITFVEEELE